jgi:hypothetical protein
LRWQTRRQSFEPPAGQPKVVAEYPFTNDTDHLITIQSVRTSCGCTTASLDKKAYKPGEKGKITAVFTVGDRQGRQDKTIFVQTDDPKESTVLLRMEIDLPQAFLFSSHGVYWRQGEPPSPKTLEMAVAQKQPVKVLSAKALGEGFDVELKEVVAGRVYRLVVTPKQTSHSQHVMIELTTDLPKGPRQSPRLYAAVIPQRPHPATRPGGAKGS